jgi:hypothetical protein
MSWQKEEFFCHIYTHTRSYILIEIHKKMIKSDGFGLLFTLYPSLVYFEITGWIIFPLILFINEPGEGPPCREL